jgi:hypothetical protein
MCRPTHSRRRFPSDRANSEGPRFFRGPFCFVRSCVALVDTLQSVPRKLTRSAGERAKTPLVLKYYRINNLRRNQPSSGYIQISN